MDTIDKTTLPSPLPTVSLLTIWKVGEHGLFFHVSNSDTKMVRRDLILLGRTRV